jgi:CsoR family transcriptional regulator, copper-sensing transcriptional repressor
MDAQTRAKVLRRLSYVTGHLQGIKKMTEEDRYCVDILKQSYAVRRALEKVEAIILEGHLNTCVVEGIQTGKAREVVNELIELYEQAGR